MSDTPELPESADTPNPESPPRRAIRSFVMRAGRMTEGQQKGIDQGWPRFGLSLDQGMLDLDALFGRSAPRTLCDHSFR